VFNREVLADTGRFFAKDSDRLAALLGEVEKDPRLVADLRRRGPDRIRQEYTWGKVSRQYEELFREVAGA
jgi:glycosyltransferase involved in cell wall biosynthesis